MRQNKIEVYPKRSISIKVLQFFSQLWSLVSNLAPLSYFIQNVVFLADSYDSECDYRRCLAECEYRLCLSKCEYRLCLVGHVLPVQVWAAGLLPRERHRQSDHLWTPVQQLQGILCNFYILKL